MTQEITTISPLFSTPYLTTAEYRQAPTSVDVDDLVGGGSSAVNEQELTNVIARASSLIDGYCGQVLAATQDTESFRCRVSRDGMLRVHPRYWPVIEVVSCSYGTYPTMLSALDPTTAWIEQMAIVFPMQGFGATFMGPIQFGPQYSTTREMFMTLTYVNGYANTLLGSSSSVGATSLPVSDLIGFMPNQQFMVYDGASTEILRVASTFTPASGAGSLPLATPAVNAHSQSVSVSALPPAVKQAAIFVTNYLLKTRGTSAIVMQSLTPSGMQTGSVAGGDDLADARDLLKPYRRVR